MRTLPEFISAIWREGNMPKTTRQEPPRPAPLPFDSNGDILDGGVTATDLATSKLNVAIYGRNRVGKTTLACQGEGPIALISIEPSPTGGARSVSNRSDITVYQVAVSYLKDRSGQLERFKGSEKVLAIADALGNRFSTGKCPFVKVVVDGVTSWNDIILCELLKTEYNSMPAILGVGKIHKDTYTERGENLIRYLRPLLSLPCDVWVIGQEKDHNPPKDQTVTKSGKDYSRPTQSRLMQEAHPMAQEGSFFSLAVGDTQAKWIQDACDFVMQLYEDNEWKEEKLQDVIFNGQVTSGGVHMVPTGRRVRRLRCTYHPNYAAGPRACNYQNVPEYIEAPTPEDMYTAFLDMAAGKKTKWGYYPHAPAS